jgi:tetratricopeptide (TPR) repeat protein
MTFAAALASASAQPTDPDLLVELADSALQEGEEELALPIIARGAAARAEGYLWQWKGLLERSLDEHELAIDSFDRAAQIDPLNASIAHGRARVALEAGRPAEALFEAALRLSSADGSVLLGLAAARLAAGHGDRAEAELAGVLSRSPLWIAGHLHLAQLRSMLGKPDSATASIEDALRLQSANPTLWQALFDLELKREKIEALEAAIERARNSGIARAVLLPYEAIAAGEAVRSEDADRLFGENEAAGGPGLAVWRVRHLLRTGRAEQALPLIDLELTGPGAAEIWPYAGIAWRLVGDPRWEWLNREGSLVAELDLTDELPPLDRLASVLRSIHLAKGEYLDQSVRGGTQTDGPLFSRLDPEIRAVRAAVRHAVERYVAALPPIDPAHPLLSRRRDRRVRFAGSWSVRLKDSGFHASHVHSQGWISSALYVSLPADVAAAEPRAGCLQLGQPKPELNVQLEPLRVVKPLPGRLVLFPSWMWHGTMPFAQGERLTIAFDVSVPR